MANMPWSLLATVLLLACASCGGDSPGSEATRSPFTPSDCGIKIGLSGGWTRECGVVEVPLVREGTSPPTATLDIYVERFRRGKGRTVVYLTGGPGIGLDAYAGLGVFDKLLAAQEGEVLLVEQRGNPRSSGKLLCGDGEPQEGCLARLGSEGAFPEAYNSIEAAADVVAVLDAFGHQRAVLWGHSYGSGLAQFVLERHADRVESVILEGVSDPVTPRSGDPTESRAAILTSFGAWYSARCAADTTCAALYPQGVTPVEDVMGLITKLEASPDKKIVLDGASTLAEEDLAAWFINGLASHDGMLGFVQLVHAEQRTTAEDRGAMTAWLQRIGGGDPAAGAAAVKGFLSALERSTVLATNTVKSCFDLDLFAGDPSCAPLARGPYEKALFQLTRTWSMPTLFLNGALDTQTLPQETALVLPRFSSVTQVTLGDCIGHFSYLDGGACSDEVVRRFLLGDSRSSPPAECEASSLCEGLPLDPRFSP